jgi:transposase
MEAIVECCAGLDVHQATVLACLNSGPVTKRSRKEVRTFGATRPELEELRAWLAASGCTLVAMESTGIYWRPVYAVLEGHFDLIPAFAGTAMPSTSRTCRAARPM